MSVQSMFYLEAESRNDTEEGRSGDVNPRNERSGKSARKIWATGPNIKIFFMPLH